MNEQEFKNRTKQLGLRVIQFVDGLPRSFTVDVLVRQLLRSATSVGANYRAACRGKSNADVIAKLSVVEEETDETLFWFELLGEASLVSSAKLDKLNELMSDANEILAMTVTSIKTLRTRAMNERPGIPIAQSKIQNPKSKIR
jgi:four helix bundle protein